ncbi:helix-turn-helix transcriptional regulator [Halofilum ochraceum]|uniref:helix-turn-helix transcriptional regulator n=1 Tax=Halofilum ochraceum TaxID=1611323 RepID=UPI0008DA0AEB|nr:helix-turn-helix transcriptional regulator [Halofilum ochraceum]
MPDGDPDRGFLAEAVGNIYDAAIDPATWEVFLEHLACRLDAESASLRVIDEEESSVRASVDYNLESGFRDAYRSYYVSTDVYLEAFRSCRQSYVATGEQILNGRDIRDTEFFTGYLQPRESWFMCGGVVVRDDPLIILISLERSPSAGPFSDADASLLRLLVPHIRRATRIGHMLTAREQQATVAGKALESLSVGIVLLDDSYAIRHANRRAERMLDRNSGIKRVNGRLTASNPADAVHLRDLLAAMSIYGRERQWSDPDAILLSAVKGEPQWLLVARPVLSRQPHVLTCSSPITSAVFISSLADAGFLDRDVLMTLYALTETEAWLACELACGQDLNGLSNAWGISRETLRTHLKRVLSKTNTRKQVDLVRLLTGKPWNLGCGADGRGELQEERQDQGNWD